MRVLPCWSDYQISVVCGLSSSAAMDSGLLRLPLRSRGVLGVISGVISSFAAVELKLEPPVGRGRRGELNLNKKCACVFSFFLGARLLAASEPRTAEGASTGRRYMDMGRHGEAWGGMRRHEERWERWDGEI